MTEPAEEQPDPRTIARPEPCESGGRQDDSQSPFLTTGTPLISGVTSAERTNNHEQIKPNNE